MTDLEHYENLPPEREPEEEEKDWETRLLEMEKHAPSFEFPKRQTDGLPLGERPDPMTTVLGGLFAGGIISVGWFVLFYNDWFESPWSAVALAAGILYGVRFASSGSGPIQTATSAILYILFLVVTLGLTTYYGTPRLFNNELDLATLEDQMYIDHIRNFNNLGPYLVGLATIFILAPFGKRRY